MDGDVFVPRYLKLSPDALDTFERFRRFLHAGKAALDGREREWWSKGPSHVLRLAGTLAFLDWSMRGNQPLTYANKDDFKKLLQNAEEPTEVGAHEMNRAVHLWKAYFWPHARAALRQAGLSEKHANARRVLRWIRAHGKDVVSLQDIRRHALNERLDAAGTEALLAELEKAGWLHKTTTETDGRPLHRWQVNPALLGVQEKQQRQEGLA